MKKTKLTRATALLLAAMMTIGTLLVPASASTEYEDSKDTTSSTVTTSTYSSTSYLSYKASQIALLRPKQSANEEKLSDDQIIAMNKQPVGTSYALNLHRFEVDSVATRKGIYLNGLNASDGSVLAGYADIEAKLPEGTDTIYLPETGAVTWTVDIDKPGFYTVEIQYYTLSVDGKISSCEKKLLIDDELLFGEATSLVFDKQWSYTYNYFRKDAQGPYVFVAESNGTRYKVEKATGRYEVALDTDKADAKYDIAVGTFYLEANAAKAGKSYSDDRYTYAFEQDVNGNDLRSDCVQDPRWSTYTLEDNSGFVSGNLEIYFSEGEHKITLAGSREGILVKSVSLLVAEDVQSYAEYTEAHKNKTDFAENGAIIKIEAESPDYVSDSSVYPSNDRSSAINSPTTPASQLMNVIGKESYSTTGMWAAYKFAVTKSGFYNITSRFKQTTLEGMFASRVMKLAGGEYGMADGTATLPFAEAANIRFDYKNGWQTAAFGYHDANNEFHEFSLYFEEGVEYTLVLEVGLGDMAKIVETIENSLNTINNCYLNILKLTGTSPDEYRSYNFNRVMPGTIRDLREQGEIIEGVANRLSEIAGGMGSNTATLTTISLLLEKMGNNEDEIAANLSNLKSYIGTLGTWLNTAKEQLVTVDFMTVQPQGTALPKDNANFFQSAWFEIRAFVVSFFTDYNAMGETVDTHGNEIDVWLAYGRDQAQIWRSLVDDQFTSVEGIGVNLKLVVAGTLLPSVLCGQGPDVYIGLAATDTINYAIRSAIEGLSQFEDLDTYITGETDMYGNVDANYDASAPRFAASALVPLQLYGETYGIPETSAFNMMFVRDDVLEGLGIAIPKTWDDMLAAVPVLQANNMEIGITYSTAFNIFLYQRGSGLWKYNGTDIWEEQDAEYAGAQIAFDSNIALEAFTDVCRLYTDYSFPVAYDVSNRFRTGEQPLVIADYVNTYNTLTVFATEIAGMWSFVPIPGTENYIDENGNFTIDRDKAVINLETGEPKTGINNVSMTTVTASILLYNATRSEANTKNAWLFIKWQCGDTAQAEYGNKMVALIGPSAKYASANTRAIRNLSWTAAELENITAQLDYLAAVENYPGSYYIARYVQFAFYDAYNDDVEPSTSLQNYVNTINKEISRKREEFDLPTLEIGQTPDEARANRTN